MGWEFFTTEHTEAVESILKTRKQVWEVWFQL